MRYCRRLIFSTIVDLAGTNTVADTVGCDWRSQGSTCPVPQGFWKDVGGEVQSKGYYCIQRPLGDSWTHRRYLLSPFVRRITSETDMTDLHGWTLIVVMSYEKNHLLYDYYNFPEEMYKVKFESKGSPPVASRVVELLKQVWTTIWA